MTNSRPGKATPIKPEKKLRKWFIYNINARINRLRKEGKL